MWFRNGAEMAQNKRIFIFAPLPQHHFVSCILSSVSCLTPPVSCFLSHVFCVGCPNFAFAKLSETETVSLRFPSVSRNHKKKFCFVSLKKIFASVVLLKKSFASI